jgi:hypothetical protein
MKRIIALSFLLLSVFFLMGAGGRRLRLHGNPNPPAPAVTNLVDVAGAIIYDVGGGQIEAVK